MSLIVASGSARDLQSEYLHYLARVIQPEPVDLVLTGVAAVHEATFPSHWEVRSVATKDGLLVPEQWGLGLRAAKAPLVAFSTPDLWPTPHWWPHLRTLLAGPGVAGASGGIALGKRTMAASSALLTRYSRFLPGETATVREVAELPGEVTVYRREALMAYPDLVANGFWETHYHPRLLGAGWRLLFASDVLATCHTQTPLVAMAQQRFRHGVRFGADLVEAGRRSRLGTLLRAPFVPPLLVVRSLRRALATRWGREACLRGVLPLVVNSIAWACGEATGAIHRSRAT